MIKPYLFNSFLDTLDKAEFIPGHFAVNKRFNVLQSASCIAAVTEKAVDRLMPLFVLCAIPSFGLDQFL